LTIANPRPLPGTPVRTRIDWATCVIHVAQTV